MALVLELRNNVVPPPNGVAPPSTLDREGVGKNTNLQRKDYIITIEQLNTLGYIARAWAHYKITLEGPPLPRLMHRVRV